MSLHIHATLWYVCYKDIQIKGKPTFSQRAEVYAWMEMVF